MVRKKELEHICARQGNPQHALISGISRSIGWIYVTTTEFIKK